MDELELSKSWERLGFSVSGHDPWTVTIPSFVGKSTGRLIWSKNSCVSMEQRAFGLGPVQPGLLRENDPGYDFCNKAIDNLVGQGFQETCNYSLRSSEETSSGSPSWRAKRSPRQPLDLRPHARPALPASRIADVLAHNQKNLNDLQGVFETGRVFRPGPKETSNA